MGEAIRKFLTMLSKDEMMGEKVADVFAASIKVDDPKVMLEGFALEADGTLNILTFINNLLAKIGEAPIVQSRRTMAVFK